ncbi:MAG: helix-turn-helix domain-containing protein [Prevotellaceae bacterium]|nr:helix-turn-helix domain-containing protein [Prevotellaceae bacterium]
MKIYSHEEMLDRVLGIDTPARQRYEENKKAFLMGEAIKEARLSKHLTQEQLGELIGVKRSQVSKIENGHNLTFTTLAKVFKALNITAFLEMTGVGKVALW